MNERFRSLGGTSTSGPCPLLLFLFLLVLIFLFPPSLPNQEKNKTKRKPTARYHAIRCRCCIAFMRACGKGRVGGGEQYSVRGIIKKRKSSPSLFKISDPDLTLLRNREGYVHEYIHVDITYRILAGPRFRRLQETMTCVWSIYFIFPSLLLDTLRIPPHLRN
ncbi:hypothetical protein F4810DRAFT_652133 [Camillea tinctor]|nr:hypothetical protein F4810DRAFT_652133 [Camillea tinctor]